jgi:uncharacterized protein YigE (DUF2233 family)
MPAIFLALLSLVLSTNYTSYTAKPESIHFYYEYNNHPIHSLNRLAEIEPALKFATNASMFQTDYGPVGLYVEDGKVVSKAAIFNNPSLDAGMQPQGVFAITKAGKAVIVPIKKAQIASYKYAVQCSPLLVMDGKVNPQLTKSRSKNKRSGYGLLKDGRVLFAISNDVVTFQEFAAWFVAQGCAQAVYIDGVVSDYWTPGHDAHPRAMFGVMVGVK